MELSQRKFLNWTKFKICDRGVQISTTSIGISNECTIHFEDITNTISKYSKRYAILFYPVVFFIIFTVIACIDFAQGKGSIQPVVEFIIPSLLFLGIFFVTSKKCTYIKLSNNKFIVFHTSIPNKETVDFFISEMFLRRNEYLKNKYAYVDKDFPIEKQLNKLMWLLENDIITKDEFQNLKKQLSSKSNDCGKTMGFRIDQ